jgi:two-component system cell cycle sensor histidine kinase/response regulator CckA
MKRMHTVLVVEDETSLRKFIGALLKDNGYRVLDTATAQQALDIAENHHGPIHVLLSDILLAGPMDGLELGAEIRRLRPRIRTLFMSGHGGDMGERLGLESLCDFFLAKPFTAKALMGMLDTCMAGEPGVAAELPRGRAGARR